MRYFSLAVMLILLASILSCKSFVPDEGVEKLEKWEDSRYVLLKDITHGDLTLKSGTAVGIITVTGKDWVKIYGYDASVDLLVAERVLLLYLFEDVFPDEKYDETVVQARFAEIARPVEK